MHGKKNADHPASHCLDWAFYSSCNAAPRNLVVHILLFLTAYLFKDYIYIRKKAKGIRKGLHAGLQFTNKKASDNKKGPYHE